MGGSESHDNAAVRPQSDDPFQLETPGRKYSPRARARLIGEADRGSANVASHQRKEFSGGDDFAREGSGSGLAIGARDCHDASGEKLRRQFYLSDNRLA